MNRQALDWSTVRMEQRPQGKASLIPAQAFEHEVHFLQPLPPYLPAPYLILERSVDEYGYVAVDANYYWVPGTGRGRLTVLRYEDQLQIYVAGQLAINTPWPPTASVTSSSIRPINPPPTPSRGIAPQPSDEEERLRALAPTVSAYVDFLLATPGHLRHQTLRRLWALSQRMSPELFVRAVERAHRYRLPELKTLERLAHLVVQATPGQLPCRPLMSPFATVLPTRTARSPKPPTSPPTMTDELQAKLRALRLPRLAKHWDQDLKRPPASGCPMPPCSLTSWKRSTVSRATAPGSSACGAPVCPSPGRSKPSPSTASPSSTAKPSSPSTTPWTSWPRPRTSSGWSRTGCGKTGLASSFLVGAIQRGATGRYVLFADLVARTLSNRRPPRPGSGAPEVSALGPAPDR
ncbi:MAG: hypothetical protein M5U12_17640 [Verrucomicrobia bacterium]|nr:hypothetical protein [Verrucomicrobiota bacterium]